MAYNTIMIFIETSIFTKEIQNLISDDNYRMLQTSLMLRPDAGRLIRGSGGLRKIRWNLPGKGKRGALRIIYYWNPPDTIFMLFPYKKTEQEDLTPEQLKLLRGMVRELLS
jgi:mRNA-degrading endonuclease RelE of RelBE toxin-antitoxin system